MSGTRSRGRMSAIIWAVLLGAGFGTGLQSVFGDMGPPCVNCNCKNVFHWWSSSFPTNYLGRGAMTPGTSTNISYGINNISIASGCPGGTLGTNGTCDIWDFKFAY